MDPSATPATPTPKLTADLLRSYSDAALGNADELLAEAALLLEHDHVARAYFLAVSCIEEVGKTLHSFDAQNRNLADPAVCTKLKANLENHSRKINYALGVWALNDSDPRAALHVAIDLIIGLGAGESLRCILTYVPIRTGYNYRATSSAPKQRRIA